MFPFRTQLKDGFRAGARKGWGSFVWILKIIIPVSFLVTLLQWTGWLGRLDLLMNPLMSLLNLPPEAAVPIVCGMVINVYAVIAIVSVIPFTLGQKTLIAIFVLISHNLIGEGIIQRKSGISAAKITTIRIVAAILTVLIVSQVLGDTSQSVIVPVDLMAGTPIAEVLKTWAVDMAWLLLRILGIIMAIMIALEFLKLLGWTEYLLKFLQPVMKVLRLSDRTAMMWVTAIMFGVLYGGAIIIEEAKKGDLTKEELERLHISIGINHSMVEDPSLFLALGLNGFWLWIPRFITAVVAVQTYRAINHLKNKSFYRSS
jgi:Fe2+ transport system protein B